MPELADYLFVYNYHLKYKAGVYALVNVAEARWYIGSSKDMMRRADQHFHQLYAGEHPNYKFQTAYDLYGASVFSIVVLEHCDEDSLAKREGVWLSRLWKRAYNIRRSTARPDLSALFRSQMKNRRII